MQSNIYQQQGRDHYKRGEYQKALECFDRAIGRAVSAQLLDNRAACNARLNDFPAALKDAKKAINLAREDPTGYLRAGKILLAMDRKSVALEIYAYGLKSVKHIGQGYEALRKAHGELLSELAPAKSIDPFTVLPREIALNILEYLDFRDRTAIMRTSKQWRLFIRSEPNLWSHLDFSKARRKRVRTAFVTTAINTAGRKIRQATITAKNYDVEKVLAALARHTTLEKLVLPDIARFDQACVDALKSARHLNHIVVGYEVEVSAQAWKSFFGHFTPQLKHVELDLTASRDLGRMSPLLPDLNISCLLTLNVKVWFLRLPELMQTHIPAPPLQSLSIRCDTAAISHDYEMDLRQFLDLRHVCLHLGSALIKRLYFPPKVEILKLGGTSRALRGDLGSDQFHPHRLDLPKLVELELDHICCTVGELLATLDQPQTETDEPGRVVTPLRKLTLHRPLETPISRWSGEAISPARLAFDSEMRNTVRLNALEHLAIVALSDLPDDHLIDLVKCAPNLQSLDIGRSLVSGIALKAVVQMRNLKELRVGPSRDWPRDAVEWARGQGVRVHVTPYVEPRTQPGPQPHRGTFPF